MSHMVYPNLARVDGFPERGLNYTGIILDDWDSPTLLIHPFLLLLTLTSAGLPAGGWAAWWNLLNIVIIHPMDLFVGALGVGPKYLVDEYAVLDTRYWVLSDPVVYWVSVLEFFVMLPLEYMWYRSLVRGEWQQHYWAILASTFQLVGTIFYLGCEMSEDYVHLPGVDWPPKFDSYVKVKYFWFVFVFLNNIWVVLPILVIFNAYRSLGHAMAGKEKSN